MKTRLLGTLILVVAFPLTGQTKSDILKQKTGPAAKETSRDYSDRKRSVLDLSNLILRFSNAAILGYNRWGLNHEFPAGSMDLSGCCTYYWTMAPMIGGLIDGQPSVAVGVRGTYRDHEEEFEPLPGYDSGFMDTVDYRVGIAFSDMPDYWPEQWPIEIDSTGTYCDSVTGLSFPGIEMPLDMEQPDGSGLRFPGVDSGVVRSTLICSGTWRSSGMEMIRQEAI